jgi:hypothetical protein
VLIFPFPFIDNLFTVDWWTSRLYRYFCNPFQLNCKSKILNLMSSEISFVRGMFHIRQCLSWIANSILWVLFIGQGSSNQHHLIVGLQVSWPLTPISFWRSH